MGLKPHQGWGQQQLWGLVASPAHTCDAGSGHPPPATPVPRDSLSPACLKLQRSGKISIHSTRRLVKDFPGASILNHPQQCIFSFWPHLAPLLCPSPNTHLTTPFPPQTQLLFFPVTPNQPFVPGTKSCQVSAVGFPLPCFPIQLFFGNARAQSKPAVTCGYFKKIISTGIF